jgi:hypothetical protein
MRELELEVQYDPDFMSPGSSWVKSSPFVNWKVAFIKQ